METSRHVVRNINRGFKCCTDHSCQAFLGITGKFHGFAVGIGTCWRIADGGKNEWVVSCTEADGSHAAEDCGHCTCEGIRGALIVQINGGFVSGLVSETKSAENWRLTIGGLCNPVYLL